MLGFFGALIIGVAVGFGIFEIGAMISTILIVAGLVIGMFNVGAGEKVSIMVASLLIGGGAGILANLPFVGEFIVAILTTLAMVVLPAGLVVAFKVIMDKAK